MRGSGKRHEILKRRIKGLGGRRTEVGDAD